MKKHIKFTPHFLSTGEFSPEFTAVLTSAAPGNEFLENEPNVETIQQ